MKKIILILLFLCSLAMAGDKPFLITITKDNCNWCDMMKQNVILKSDVKALLETKFVVKIINRNNPELIPKVIKNTRFFPTTYIVSSDKKKLLDELPGFMSAYNLLDYFDLVESKE